MAEEHFSDALRRLVAEHIASVAALEVLLLLRASRPTLLGPSAVAAQLRIDHHFASLQLDALVRAGLLEAGGPGEPGYRYAPATPELEATIEELEIAYVQRRVSLVSLIYSTPRDRALAFADAFRVRKEPEDG